MVLDEMTGRREPMQLLYPEETLGRQYRERGGEGDPGGRTNQRQGDAASVARPPVVRGNSAAGNEVCAYPGMLATVRGFLDKVGVSLTTCLLAGQIPHYVVSGTLG